jgi:hypothetical protein
MGAKHEALMTESPGRTCQCQIQWQSSDASDVRMTIQHACPGRLATGIYTAWLVWHINPTLVVTY